MRRKNYCSVLLATFWVANFQYFCSYSWMKDFHLSVATALSTREVLDGCRGARRAENGTVLVAWPNQADDTEPVDKTTAAVSEKIKLVVKIQNKFNLKIYLLDFFTIQNMANLLKAEAVYSHRAGNQEI